MSRRKYKTRTKGAPEPVQTATHPLQEFAQLGKMEFAYVRTISYEQARALFPHVRKLPKETAKFYALCHADGMPIALTDTFTAAVGHAHEGDLETVYAH
ncbi:MAG: DUF1150 family protein [Candidatus Pacebacteria bacterium]|nr:DUF1150 family protein [Candidatus Paceibacterota bacterium]